VILYPNGKNLGDHFIVIKPSQMQATRIARSLQVIFWCASSKRSEPEKRINVGMASSQLSGAAGVMSDTQGFGCRRMGGRAGRRLLHFVRYEESLAYAATA
jgi:hypothetical protein